MEKATNTIKRSKLMDEYIKNHPRVSNLYNAKELIDHFTKKLAKDTKASKSENDLGVSEYQSIINNYDQSVADQLFSKNPTEAINALKSVNGSDLTNIKNRIIDLLWLYTLKKSPNYKAVPNAFVLEGAKDVDFDQQTPAGALFNTKGYLNQLKNRSLVSPKWILNYCQKNLDKFEHQTEELAKERPNDRKYWSKFLTNDYAKLVKIDKDANNTNAETDLQWEILTKQIPQDYHEALTKTVVDKLPYARLATQIKRDIKKGNAHDCFLSDVTSPTNYDDPCVYSHRDSKPAEVADYYNYVILNKPIL